MMIKRIRYIILIALISYVCVELVCMIFMYTRFKAAHRPDFNYQRTYLKYDFPFAEINPMWGMWHYPGYHLEEKSCFRVDYHCNSYGARDVEREMNGDTNRIVVLGDSFIEGYGLSEEDRFSNRLQGMLQIPVLNFGCGYFTPTQEMLVYENLAAEFSQHTVIIGLFPFNDFSEDDTSYHENDGFVHYQPFLEGDYPNYRLIYREDQLSKSTFNKEGYYRIQNSPAERRRRFLKSFTYWYNLYHYISSQRSRATHRQQVYSGYFDVTDAQIQKLKYILERIKLKAGSHQLIVMTIPAKQDFERCKSGKPILQPLIQKMAISVGFQYIDLLDVYRNLGERPDNLYLKCDGHWNERANRIAAQKVVDLLRK